jgi:glycosyltransferase involved in cell wall biosynthesis
MKLGILITGLGTGGAENHLLKLLPRVKFDKFVISLTNENSIGKEIEKKGIKVYYLGMTKWNLFSTWLKVRKIIRDEKPDVLDTYLIHANILGRFVGAKKVVNSVRNDYSDMVFLKFLDRITKRRVSLYTPNSNALKTYLHSLGVKDSKIKVIPNGIDLKEIKINKKYSLKKELGLNPKDIILTCVARLMPQKNQQILIETLTELDTKYKLVLVGDGPDKNKLVVLADTLKVSDRVYFLGTRKDVPNILNCTDIFILPSKKEGMSNALLEAMALGKVCVVSDIPHNTELIKNGVNGLTFKNDGFTDLVKKIIFVNKNKAKSFELNVKKDVSDFYDVNKTVNLYLNEVNLKK